MAERKFVIDGMTYRSIDDVPSPDRAYILQLFADSDGDGVPDVFEPGARATHDGRPTTFQVGDTTYHSIDDVPEPHRSALRAAFSAPGPAAPATAGGQALVRPARLSSQAKLIVGFVLIDAAIAAVAVWWVTS